MSKLIVPAGSAGIQGAPQMVSSDLYDIARRIKEIDPNLTLMIHKGHKQPWVVMERCADGVERFVSRYETADDRILKDLRRMLATPFLERLDALENRIAAENEAKQHMPEETFERFAWDFHKALVDSNMVAPKWGRSYRKVKNGS
jgi:hypothetical protein